MSRVLVTGATGFVGRRTCAELARRGHELRLAVREGAQADMPGEFFSTGPIGPQTDWSAALSGVDTVVHLAARVHVMKETATDPLTEFRAMNVDATEALARSAAARGVKRFVYVSSIKVNGEATLAKPFHSDDSANPQDAYGISKWEAELALRRLSDATGLDVVVVRPPLVYGPGVAGNFLRLLKLVERGIPLPLGAIDNRRSMIYNGNLAHVLAACAFDARAAGKTYLVSDGEDISTTELLCRLAHALGRSARLVPVPKRVLEFAGRLTGRSAEVDRLIGSLMVDSERIHIDLDWSPPYSMQEGLHETARWFLTPSS